MDWALEVNWDTAHAYECAVLLRPGRLTRLTWHSKHMFHNHRLTKSLCGTSILTKLMNVVQKLNWLHRHY
jgi:hypothetical protein